jgi:hypothetical protein
VKAIHLSATADYLGRLRHDVIASLNETRIRRLTASLLVGGLLASILVRATFYVLLMITHPPAPLHPGSTAPTIEAWIQSYAIWRKTTVFYSKIYGWSIIAGLGFLVALGVFIAPRWALLASFSLLNVYFAYTSGVLRYVSPSLGSAVGRALLSECNFLWIAGSLAYFLPSYYVVLDLESLALLGTQVVSAFMLTRVLGVKRAALLSSQVASLSLAILGTEIAIFDNVQLSYHVTTTQALLSFFPWFSNADLLFSGLTILALSSCLLNFGRLWHQRY